MHIRSRFILALLAVPMLCLPVRFAAASDDGAQALVEVDGPNRTPELTLRAQASVSVLQDTVTMSFARNLQGKSSAEVNQQLAQAIDQARKLVTEGSPVKASSGPYRVTPTFSKDGKISGWQGHAELTLVSSDFPAIAALSTKMAGQLELANVYFSLSDQARQTAEARLLDQVAGAFRERAQRAASAFGFTRYTVKRVDLGGSGAMPQPAPAMLMRAAPPPSADTAPRVDVPLVPDQVSVSISVSGTVYLH